VDAMEKGGNLNGMTNPMMLQLAQNPGMGMVLPEDESIMNYYQEYCRLFIANVVLTTQMKELVAEKNELLAKLTKLEQKSNEDFNNTPSSPPESYEDKKKRFRRTAAEIDRQFRCPVETCQKSYGIEGSLNHHIKLKHPEILNISDVKIKSTKKEPGDSV